MLISMEFFHFIGFIPVDCTLYSVQYIFSYGFDGFLFNYTLINRCNISILKSKFSHLIYKYIFILTSLKWNNAGSLSLHIILKTFLIFYIPMPKNHGRIKM